MALSEAHQLNELAVPKMPGHGRRSQQDNEFLGGDSPSQSTSASGIASPRSTRSYPSSETEESPDVHAEGKGGAWCIDADIGTHVRHGEERALTRWESLAEDAASTEGLEEWASSADVHAGDKWDQFKANEALFGVESTYKSDLSQYTTPLDVSKVPARIREKAARLAREIESGRKAADHDGAGSDGDEDEEARWSAVPRSRRKSTKDSGSHKGSYGSDPLSCSMGSQETKASCTESKKVQGTFVHVDGVGIVDEHAARSTPGFFRQSLPQAPVLASVPTYTTNGALAASPPTAALTYAGGPTCTINTIAAPVATFPYAAAPTCAINTEAAATQVGADYLPPGMEVVVDGLLKAPAFNGRSGIVRDFDPQSGRYNIQLLMDNGSCQLAKVKLENLRWGIPQPMYYQ